MSNIKGNIKEDEQAAFNLICERTGLTPDDAKGVGFLNRLQKLASVAKLAIKLDYSGSGNGTFEMFGVPSVEQSTDAGIDVKLEETVPEEKPVPEHLNMSDADEDEDPFAV